MLQQRQYKLCLVADMLSGGGAERVQALLSQYFESCGIEVHHVIVRDKVTYPYAGKLLNLGRLKNRYNDPLDKFRRFRVLRNYIREHEFDYIVDFRMRYKPVQDYFISKLIYTRPSVYTVHNSKLDWYMPKQRWFTRLIYARAYGVVTVARQIQESVEALYGLENVSTIYNPADFDTVTRLAAQEPPLSGFSYIVAMGRLENPIKQFDKLIEAYTGSSLPQNNVKLVILGQGPDLQSLKDLAQTLNIGESVLFEGFCQNPYVYIRNARCLVLCSKMEGFPMALVESLACGTPVVAFDSFSGPREIIRHENNGLLVPGQDFSLFAKAMERMAFDRELHERCRANAAPSVAHLSLQAIGKQWLEYLKLEVNGCNDSFDTEN